MNICQPVTVKQLAAKTNAKVTGDGSVVITDVSHDSRRVGEGSLFVAVSGALFDAHKFIPQVMEQGAAGVLSERAAPENFAGVMAAGGRRSLCNGARCF